MTHGADRGINSLYARTGMMNKWIVDTMNSNTGAAERITGDTLTPEMYPLDFGMPNVSLGAYYRDVVGDNGFSYIGAMLRLDYDAEPGSESAQPVRQAIKAAAMLAKDYRNSRVHDGLVDLGEVGHSRAAYYKNESSVGADWQFTSGVDIPAGNEIEEITSDIAKAMANYEAILNGLVTWNTTDNQNVTVRLMTDSDPFFVDYTFPSRSASTKTAIRMLSPDVRGGGFDALNALEMPAVMSDTVTLRFSEVSYPAAQWSLYENAMAYKEDGEASVDYPEHVFVNVKGLNSSDPDAYVKVLTTVAVPSGTAFALGVNCCKAVATWTASQDTSYWKKGMLALASGGGTLGAYALTGIAGNISPAYDTENWTRVADVLDAMQANTTVRKNGAYLFSESGADDYSDASIYVYLGEDTAKQGSTPNPKSNKQYWMGPYTLIPVKTFGSSTIYRSHPTTDICGYILQSKGSAYPVEVNVLPGQAIAGGDSEPGKGLGVFNTCNYVSWPSSNTPVWHSGRKYGYGDGYTAEMVFHHSSADVKMTNIINYDGPDLDRGLAIYLPAEDVVKDDNGVSVIKDIIHEMVVNTDPDAPTVHTKIEFENYKPSRDIVRNLAGLRKSWEQERTQRTAFYFGNSYSDLKDYAHAYEWYSVAVDEFPEAHNEDRLKSIHAVL